MKFKHLVLAGLLCASSAHAEYVSISTLKRDLRGPESFSLGYVAGYADLMTGVGVICIPAKIQLRLVAVVVQTEIEAYDGPDPDKTSATDIVIGALKNRWPCAGKSNSRKELL